MVNMYYTYAPCIGKDKHRPLTTPENPSVAIFCRIECTHKDLRYSDPQVVSSTSYFHSL